MSGESDYLIRISVRADQSFERIHRDLLGSKPNQGLEAGGQIMIPTP